MTVRPPTPQAIRDRAADAWWSAADHESRRRGTRITIPTRHARYGYAQAFQHPTLHIVESVAIYWPTDQRNPPFIATRWQCDPRHGGARDAALLVDLTDELEHCARCDFAGIQSAERLVYFAQRGGLIKIGCSSQVLGRMRALGCELIATTPGSYATERQLHRRFCHLRVHGEWFKPGEDLMTFIAAQRSLTATAVL